jgi:hypothetical protein
MAAQLLYAAPGHLCAALAAIDNREGLGAAYKSHTANDMVRHTKVGHISVGFTKAMQEIQPDKYDSQ